MQKNPLVNISIGAAVNGAAQIAQLIFIPVLTRLIAPELYGKYVVFLLLTSSLTMVCGLRYEAAVVISHTRKTALAVSAIVLLLGLCTASLLFFTATAFLLLDAWPKIQYLPPLLLLSAAYCILNTVQRVAMAFNLREADFRTTALANIINALGTIALQYWLLLTIPSALLALCCGFVAGQTLSLVALYQRVFLVANELFSAPPSRLLLLAALNHYSRFPRYMLAFSLNTILRDRLAQMIIGAYTSAEMLGKLAMAQRLTAAPQSLMHSGVSPVLFSFACRHSKAATARLTAILSESVLVVTGPLFILTVFWLPQLSRSMLGSKWQGIEDLMLWLVFPSMLLIATSFVDRFFDVYNSQRALMWLETSYSALLLTSVFLVCAFGYTNFSVPVYAFALTLYIICCMYIAFSENGLPLGELLHGLKQAFIYVGLYGLFFVVAARYLDGAMLPTLMAAAYVVYLGTFYIKRGKLHLATIKQLNPH